MDGDGFRARRCQTATVGVVVETGEDCDDADAQVSPAAWDGPAGDGKEDACNDGLDNDCSGRLDDGQSEDGSTCVCTPGETAPCTTTPSGLEIEYPMLDADHEPLGSCRLGSLTCFPNGTWGECTGARGPSQETCDGEDNDCDGVASAEDADAVYRPLWVCDQDGDKHLAPGSTGVVSCVRPASGCDGDHAAYVQAPDAADFDDCDDTRDDVHGRAAEYCDLADNDCGGGVDEDALDAQDWSYDADNDGFRLSGTSSVRGCSPPAAVPAQCLIACTDCAVECPLDGWRGREGALPDGDCDDSSGAVNPGVGTDPCNGGIDDDCDGTPDPGCNCSNGETESCGVAPNLDGVGICKLGTQICSGGVWQDCTGAQAPGDEVCSAEDRDCDGVPGDTDADAVDQRRWACDADGDGYLAIIGAPEVSACNLPASGAGTECDGPNPNWLGDPAPASFADCDDQNASVHPGAPETCNRKDDDCSSSGGDDPSEDDDGDGHSPVGYTGCVGGYPADDCVDSNPEVYPGAGWTALLPYCVSRTLCEGNGVWDCSEVAGTKPDGIPLCYGYSTPEEPSWDYDCNGTVEKRAADSPGFTCVRANEGLELPADGACGATTQGVVCVAAMGWQNRGTETEIVHCR